MSDNQELNIKSSKGAGKQAFSIRGLLKSVGIIVAVLILLVLGFMRLTAYTAGVLMKDQVSQHTKGAYELDYRALTIDWLTSTIKVKKATYLPVNDVGLENEFQFTVNELYVKIDGVLDIYFEKTLRIQEAYITNPKLVIKQNHAPKRSKSFTFEAGTLYESLQGFVQTFEIKRFDVTHMQLDFFPFNSNQPIQITDLSFSIGNFKMDSTRVDQNNEFFFSEFFELQLNNQSMIYNDKIHFSHFDSLKLSTKTNNIELFNVVTDTVDGASKVLNKGGVNRYFFNIPKIGVEGLDFTKAYVQNVLSIDSLLFDKPKFNVDFVVVNHDSVSKLPQDSSVDNSIISLVLQVFDRVELNHFLYVNSEISGTYNTTDSIDVSNLSVEFSGFSMDSSDLAKKPYYPSFTDLFISIEHPKFRFFKVGEGGADLLTFSTFDSTLYLKNIEYLDRAGNKDVVNISINDFYISGIERRRDSIKKEF